MFKIEHPSLMKYGTRVVFLVGRNKDGVIPRSSVRTYTNNEEEWTSAVDRLASQALPGQRIYSSAAPRDMTKAVRRFKEMQLNADYMLPEGTFYNRIQDRFISALAVPTSAAEKIWLLDIDSPEDLEKILALTEEQKIHPIYSYATKNGMHALVKPFNRSILTPELQKLIKPDGMILVGY